MSAVAAVAAACAADDGVEVDPVDDDLPPVVDDRDDDGEDGPAEIGAPNIRVEYSIGRDEMPQVTITECPAGRAPIEVCWGDGSCSRGSGESLGHRYEPPLFDDGEAAPIETYTAEVTFRGVAFEIPIEWGDYDIMRCWASGNAGAAAPVGYGFGSCHQRNSLPLEACSSGVSCGESYCSSGLECCDALCGVCVEPGQSCTQGC